MKAYPGSTFYLAGMVVVAAVCESADPPEAAAMVALVVGLSLAASKYGRHQ